MQESWEGYGKNWMHFVYKTDNLFQSIRISYGNSSVTKGFHFLKLIWIPDFLCVQNAPFKATSSFFNPFWLHLLFFMHLLIILSNKTLTFCVFKMHHSKSHHQFSTLSDIICYFSCIYWLFWAIRPWNWKVFQMNSEKV